MKKLIALVLTFLSTGAMAGDQVIPIVPAQVPVEQKVVEIHMTRSATSPEKESKRKSRSIEQMPLAGHATCSGAFIDSIGDIITARHCVDGFDSWEVVTYDARQYTAVVVATSPIHDLAVLHIDRLNTACFKPAQKVERGESISVLGSPLGITDTLSKGIVARLDGDLTLLDCSILPGNSGGPVFDADGNLVGIVTAGFVVMMGMTHLNIAQSIDAVWFFLLQVSTGR